MYVQPEVVSIWEVEGVWGPKTVLDAVANADPPYHALIDTGGLHWYKCMPAKRCPVSFSCVLRMNKEALSVGILFSASSACTADC